MPPVNSISEVQASGGVPLYQLKITLKWSKPPIWRRVVVRADRTLDRLHKVIQVAMGWTDSHFPEHADMKDWIGGEMDAAEFSLEGAKAALKRLKA
jgi:hypothetical protein